MFAGVVLGIEIVATIAAIILNFPAQFGGVGTDAAGEFAGRGTAISPPLAPLMVLAVSLVLLRRSDRWATVGCAIAVVLGILFAIGSLGEALADATPEVSKTLLVSSGIVGVLIGAILVSLAVAALIARSKSSLSR